MDLTARPHILIVALDGQLSAWQLSVTDTAPQPIPIHGAHCLPLAQAHEAASALNDLYARLRQQENDPATTGSWHLVFDRASRGYLDALCPLLNRLPQWQLLDSDWLYARLGVRLTLPKPEPHAVRTLLDWLARPEAAADLARRLDALAKTEAAERERLAQERAELIAENERLRAQNQALQRIDTENLLRFLPALYPRVFQHIGADIALLCGSLEPLAIPNPYPEPSEEVLRELQKDFRALPERVQRQIVQLVARLPQRQRLQPRPEMRDLIDQLERTHD